MICQVILFDNVHAYRSYTYKNADCMHERGSDKLNGYITLTYIVFIYSKRKQQTQ